MHITIDCRHIDASGIGVYLRGCLPYFLDTGHRLTLLGSREKLTDFMRHHQNAVIIDCSIKPFSIRELLAFPKPLVKIINQTDVYYTPYFNIPKGIKIPVYTTIHDIIFPDMPELVSKAGLFARMRFYKRAAKESTTVFTVSEFSKTRIAHHLRCKKIVVTYSAVQGSLVMEDKERCKTKTIIFIGNIKKHKGLAVLLKAFGEAVRAGLDYTLIIAGGKDNLRTSDAAIHSRIADDMPVVWTGFISREKLTALLHEASLLVQPSLYEGFGLPPLEAMTLGTCALISDIPVFKEIYAGFPVVFFRSGDALDLKDKMLDLLYNNSIEKMVLTDEQKERYTFEKTAAIIMGELCRKEQPQG